LLLLVGPLQIIQELGDSGVLGIIALAYPEHGQDDCDDRRQDQANCNKVKGALERAIPVERSLMPGGLVTEPVGGITRACTAWGVN